MGLSPFSRCRSTAVGPWESRHHDDPHRLVSAAVVVAAATDPVSA
ncbi:hypothetical protein NSERUTF1_4576 [Nocardia seriolae]|nr:hypothetical protein NSERUTF1_4576 [Nocardia seriolae]